MLLISDLIICSSLVSNIKFVSNIASLNPRPSVGLDFPRPGVCVGGELTPLPTDSSPGPRSDMGKASFERASKIRKKSFRSFFGQVKGQVTRGH